MNRDDLFPAFALTGLGILVVIILYGGILKNANPSISTGVIVDKFYTPPSTSTGTGIGADGVVTTVTTFKSAQYTLQLDNGRFISVSNEMFLKYKAGDKVKVTEGFTYTTVELIK